MLLGRVTVYHGARWLLCFTVGASVVLILLHAAMAAPPTSAGHRTVDEELGLVMEEVTVS